MNENMFTTPVVTSQSCEQCPDVLLPLAPRRSAKLLPSGAFSLGPSFPCLDTPPYFPHDLLLSESEGDQGATEGATAIVLVAVAASKRVASEEAKL